MVPRLATSPLQAGQELLPRRAVLTEGQRFGGVGLGGVQEGGELGKVRAVIAVVVVGVAAYPAGAGQSAPAAPCR